MQVTRDPAAAPLDAPLDTPSHAALDVASGGLRVEVASIVRLHIVGVAVAATAAFAWLLTGGYGLAAIAWVALDWLLINLFNRVTDVREDLTNGVPGAARVASAPRAFALAAWATLGASFAVSHALVPALTPWRALVLAIGLGYSYRIVPTRGGLRRFKDLYILKNGMSAVLFVLTVLGYPLVLAGGPVAAVAGWSTVLCVALFFVPFELSYEVFYDLRDLEGDRAEGVPTFPVVHGAATSRRIIDGLLLACVAPLALGLATGALGVREGLLLAAPAAQFAFYRPRFERGVTHADAIWITHLGTGLLLFFLAGTRVWLALGLPANIALR